MGVNLERALVMSKDSPTTAAPAMTQEDSSGVAVLDRSFAILKSFGQADDSLTLAEISRRTDLYKSRWAR
jgi:hypothetical protein